ncbi:hypothetical protein POM88_028906 [Heracleum sosnowskyi]|uniref:C3H1-type domain-containing protein n=1 Tax=Heracleum sosnowskyi TaxID=360622 RepID=A0AAD8HTR6_9APIA|nr:hypothetical protein POM88_028906 [Heracleum sosnowskyi]
MDIPATGSSFNILDAWFPLTIEDVAGQSVDCIDCTRFTLNEEGLPLRPGQSICSHFSRFRICKFGPSCKYNHSVPNDILASSNGSDQGRPFQFNYFGDEYGEWEVEHMRSV